MAIFSKSIRKGLAGLPALRVQHGDRFNLPFSATEAGIAGTGGKSKLKGIGLRTFDESEHPRDEQGRFTKK